VLLRLLKAFTMARPIPLGGSSHQRCFASKHACHSVYAVAAALINVYSLESTPDSATNSAKALE